MFHAESALTESTFFIHGIQFFFAIQNHFVTRIGCVAQQTMDQRLGDALISLIGQYHDILNLSHLFTTVNDFCLV